MAFEAILARPDTQPKRWRQAALSVSLVLHVGLLAYGFIRSLWTVEEMPMPTIQVLLTEAPPPPPPPPPPPAGVKKPTVRRMRPVAKTAEITQPTQVTNKAPEPEPEGDEGGVVGGVGDAPPPPPPPEPPKPKPTGPKLVSNQVGTRQLVINPNSPPYCCVKIPRALERSGESLFVATVRMCIDANGGVSSVQLLQSAAPGIDSQIPTYLGRWRYKPLIVDGKPTPFCYPLRYEISVR